MNPREAGLALDGLGKRFDGTEAVSEVTLALRRGELAALLGASGAGKTTLLRLIAGHLEPDAGEVWIGGELMDETPPERRNVGMVFQSAALFPHLTVRGNVAFGPGRQGLSRTEAAARADAMLERLDLAALAGRYPRQLSGGEAKRVAVARALATRPEALLLDEPLSSLDPASRRDLRSRLRGMHRDFAATTLWVTHDQEEALTVADRVAVLHRGRIQQFAAPLKLHTRPANEFVARFVGRMNLLPAVREPDRPDSFRLQDGPAVLAARDSLEGAAVRSGERVTLGVRPEVLQIGHPPPSPGFNAVGATVRRIAFLGDRLEIEMETEGGHPVAARGNTLFRSLAREGDRVRVHWPVADTRLLRRTTGNTDS